MESKDLPHANKGKKITIWLVDDNTEILQTKNNIFEDDYYRAIEVISRKIRNPKIRDKLLKAIS